MPFSPDATVLLNDFKQLQRSQECRYGDLGVLWSRARENAGKLALIFACWQDPQLPVIDYKAAEWAVQLMTHAVEHCVYEAGFCMTEGAFHERCQKILRVLRQSGAPQAEVSRSVLMRGTRNMTPRERDEAVATLAEQGSIVIRQEQTRGRPATYYRLIG